MAEGSAVAARAEELEQRLAQREEQLLSLDREVADRSFTAASKPCAAIIYSLETARRDVQIRVEFHEISYSSPDLSSQRKKTYSEFFVSLVQKRKCCESNAFSSAKIALYLSADAFS